MSFWPHPDDIKPRIPQAIAEVRVAVHKDDSLIERTITLRKNRENKYRWFYEDMQPASPEFDSMDGALATAPNRYQVTFRSVSLA